MEKFKEIAAGSIDGNFIDMIGRGWMLVTAGNTEKCNTMTASWGAAGVLWNKPAAFVFIRPQRYTKEFVDSRQRLTLSFLPEEYRKAMAYCGSHSGRDGDKIKEAGLSVWATPGGTPAIAEARLVLECRKMYSGRLKEEGFIDKGLIPALYPGADFHEMYVCEIEKAYIKEV